MQISGNKICIQNVRNLYLFSLAEGEFDEFFGGGGEVVNVLIPHDELCICGGDWERDDFDRNALFKLSERVKDEHLVCILLEAQLIYSLVIR